MSLIAFLRFLVPQLIQFLAIAHDALKLGRLRCRCGLAAESETKDGPVAGLALVHVPVHVHAMRDAWTHAAAAAGILTPPNPGDLEYTFLPSSAPHQVEEPAVCSYVLRATHPLACD